MTALETLLPALRSDPSRPVAEYRGRDITAGEFLGLSQALAIHLKGAGLTEGDVLGIAVADNVAAMQLMLAAWFIGAAPLVLDRRQSARNVADLHRRLGIRFLVGASTPGGPPGLSLPKTLEPVNELPWEPPADEALIADFFLSSGTTGVPKVAPVLHGNLARLIDRWLADRTLGVIGVTLSALSLAYPGSRTVWYRSIAAGQKIVALDLLHSLRELDAALMRTDVLDCTLPPVLIRSLAQLPPKGPGPRYPQLRKLRAIGGPATPEDKLLTLERLTPNYLMTFSSTDTGVVSHISGAEMHERPASCGRPVEGIRVEILDGERVCGPGETGRLRVYREGHDPVELGDLGWMDAEGYLYIAGRTSGLMCRHGLNVSVAEVEQALLDCPLVQDASVWSTPDQDTGDRIYALVECAEQDEPRVAAHVRRDLSNKERPDRLLFTRTMPRTPGGKPDRRAIAAAFTLDREHELDRS